MKFFFYFVLFVTISANAQHKQINRQTFYAKTSTLHEKGNLLYGQWQANINAACLIENGGDCYVDKSKIIQRNDLDNKCEGKEIKITEIILEEYVHCP